MSLSTVYEEALKNYEALHRDGKLSADEFAIIKGSKSENDILKAVVNARQRNENEKSRTTKLLRKINPAVSVLERFSGVVDTTIQSSELTSLPSRNYCLILIAYADPDIPALVWGGAKFLLVVSRKRKRKKVHDSL